MGRGKEGRGVRLGNAQVPRATRRAVRGCNRTGVYCPSTCTGHTQRRLGRGCPRLQGREGTVPGVYRYHVTPPPASLLSP
jgi:hypothetical protein